MKNFKRFSEYLRETKIADRAFLHYTGKGFEDGHYVGKPCRWRDDKNAFSGFTSPSPVEITVPDDIRSMDSHKADVAARTNAGTVSVPGFEDVIVSRAGLRHGTRLFNKDAKLRKQSSVLNAAVIPYAKEILAASVPVGFSPADDNDRGKPIKGVVWLEGLVKIRGGEKTFKVRSSVQVSAYCDFRRDSDNEEREIYSLHSMNVITRSEPSARPGL